MEIFEKLLSFLGQGYDIITTLIAIIALIWGIYSNIKFTCLKKASEMVASVEKNVELTGEQKFALCIFWLNEELPKVFKNSFFQATLEKIVQFAYDTSFTFAQKYIKRKTGYDISEIVNSLKELVKENNDKKESDQKEEDSKKVEE